MTIRHDLRFPVVVIVGHWNQAILNEPAWIARHLLKLQEGDELEVRTVVFGDGPSAGKKVWFYENFGLSCNNNRIEIFRTSTGSNDAIYTILKTICELLPHTPVSAVGVNFHFIDDGDITASAGLLETEETLDTYGNIRSSDRTDTFEIDRNTRLAIPESPEIQSILKLNRVTDFGSFQIDFNFHQDIPDISVLGKWVECGPIDHWYEAAQRMLGEVYGIEKVEQSYI